ncbi:NAD(P)H-binding protein [Wenyingzhuangia sp. 2_MG-2023]|uniref:NAD(P)H-binding protein n=1 Tax=Wenyingzhuangia sp. 2_MG-2023 TaxID=3062639 RepID=UPI0026E37953|nr:NAD(P)H-binding protein [Wenyingzhuangia sp. 2_MG-2023]MDO6736655.1 SDR family NAD(P)-dependent oxidoreductase [Wenyingzhuangia sp. 2_MG-2023]MDO6801050.1 SDR family NAD(P)-dependent oxidoreductase [Wenyingzhuangia sp. 1_MG-2023]
MKSKVFSVLGCGWLGLPLAEALIEDDFTVKGSTTSVEKCELLLSKDIQPYVLIIDEDIEGNLEHFLQADILFINVPFRKQKPFLKNYKKLVNAIEISSVEHVVFISSTSVYPDVNGEVTEDMHFDVNPAKKELIAFENLFLDNPNFNTTIIRFAGLIGGTRNPGNFFKDDRIVENALAPVNLIHLEDCIGIVKATVKQQKWNVTYNAAASTHPSKASYYKKATEQLGKKPATFVEELKTFKVVSNQKLIKELNYKFVYPDLIEGLKEFKN